MTIATTTSKAGPYSGNGSTTVFSVPFKFLAAADLEVYLLAADGTQTKQTITTHYTVSGAGAESGGSVTMVTAPASGQKLTILRVVAETQLTDFRNAGQFFPETHESAFDKLTQLVQQLSERASRAFHVLASSDLASFEFPNTGTAAQRQLKVLGFDSAGNPTLTDSSGGSADILKADLASTASGKGAALVGFIHEGAGAVATDLSVRGRRIVLSSDYGTLQQALTAAAGNVLYILPGAHALASTTLSVPGNTTVFAYGAALTWTGQVTGIALGSGCAWFGGTLIGPGNTNYVDAGKAFACVGTNNAPAAPTFVTGPIIRDVAITEWGGYGIWLAYVNGGRIHNNTISEIGYAGIGGVSCNDVEVSGNTVDTVNGAGAADWYGIFLDRLEGTETADPRSRRCRIVGNTVKNVTLWEGIDTHGGEDFLIAENLISGCRFGIAVVSSDISGVESLGSRRVTVCDNIIDGSSTGAAIVVKGAPIQYAQNIVIANNNIRNGGWAGDAAEGCIRIYDCLDVMVRGNTLRNPYVLGIHLLRNIFGATVTGNYIVDVRDATYATPSAISVRGNNISAGIDGNTIVYQDSGAAAFVSTRAIDITAGLTGLNIEIGKNHLLGVDATHLAYVASTTTGVNATALQSQTGAASLSLTAAVSFVTIPVNFPKRFPSVPKVTAQITSPVVPGGVLKASLLECRNQSATGFDLTARSYDLTNFGGAGTLTVDWVATT